MTLGDQMAVLRSYRPAIPASRDTPAWLSPPRFHSQYRAASSGGLCIDRVSQRSDGFAARESSPNGSSLSNSPWLDQFDLSIFQQVLAPYRRKMLRMKTIYHKHIYPSPHTYSISKHSGCRNADASTPMSGIRAFRTCRALLTGPSHRKSASNISRARSRSAKAMGENRTQSHTTSSFFSSLPSTEIHRFSQESYAGGRQVQGLLNRRRAERDICMRGL